MTCPPAWPVVKCDKCKSVAHEHVTCPTCGKEYHRCEEHAGAKRSLHSHAALYHPSKVSR